MVLFARVQLDILEYIHDKEYVHADVKASNLLVGYTDPQQVSTFCSDRLLVAYKLLSNVIITFRMRRRRREMCGGHGCLCVCP